MFLAVALIIAAVLFFRSPIAPAAADAIRQVNGLPVRGTRLAEAMAQLNQELGQLREEFTELAERVDFTERALADVRRRDALQNPRS